MCIQFASAPPDPELLAEHAQLETKRHNGGHPSRSRGSGAGDNSTERFEMGATGAEPGTGIRQKTGTPRSALG
jgi:hypothetical protein